MITHDSLRSSIERHYHGKPVEVVAITLDGKVVFYDGPDKRTQDLNVLGYSMNSNGQYELNTFKRNNLAQ